MSQMNRRDALRGLYERLGEIQPADEKSRQVIADARADIERTLAADTPEITDEDETLVERLQDAVYHFEGEHPDLALAISTVITSLSNMGL
jgi:hypothetical protein